MGYFDELYAGFFGKYSPLWEEIKQRKERVIIDVEYVDLSDEIESDRQITCETASIHYPISLIEKTC